MIGYFARHPTAANLLMFAMVLIGVLSLPDLQRETYPEFEADVIQVRASYAGADAETMDQLVIARVEDVVTGVEGVASIVSSAREGSATVSIEVADGVDVDSLVADIDSAVATIGDFPTDMDDPSVEAKSRSGEVATIAVTGRMSGKDLKLYLDRLKRQLLTEPEVSQVSIAGFSTRQLRISVDSASLARYHLDLDTISSAITANSLDSPLGELDTRGRTLLVRYQDKRVTAAQLRGLVVTTSETGADVLLGEVASVEDTFSIDEEQTYVNGERGGMLVVGKASTEDSLEVFEAIERFIAQQEELKPAGVAFTITSDSTSVIEQRLALLTTNAGQGLILVFIALWLFFNIRLAFWVAAGVPVSFLTALWVMSITGQSLNMMTMMGLLVAIGLLMDDAIVLAENVASHLEAGAKPLDAATRGVKEVAGGVFSSFATTICVFVPLTAIDGRIGRTLQAIPAVLIAVLAVSLIEAFLILPNHLGHSMRSDLVKSRFRVRFDRAFASLREGGLGRAVDFAIRHRHATVGLTLAFVLASVGAVVGGKLPYQAFVDSEGDLVEFQLEMPSGTALEVTQREAERVVAAAQSVSARLTPEQPEGKPLVVNTSVRFNYNKNVDETGPHLATVSVDLLSVEERTITLAEFTRQWREELGPIPNAVSAGFGAGGRRGPGGNAIEIRVQGDDLARIDAVADEVKTYFADVPGVSDLGDDLELGAAQVRIRLRQGAGATGLTGSLVATQIKTALSGASIETVHDRGEELEVFLLLDRHHRDTVADVEALMIKVNDNTRIPLGAIATVEQTRGYGRVNRNAGMRTVSVTGALDQKQYNLAQLMDEFRDTEMVRLSTTYPDLGFEIGGESEDSAATLGSMSKGAGLGLLAILVVLSLQLRTYVEPLLVMLAIPFAFVGVVIGSLAMGDPLSSQSILGFVSLAGIVVNDSILLMLFIKRARASGMDVTTAAQQASRERFRAVLLTSITTIVGLLPLLFETSRQAQMLVPVASSIVFGLSASTVLVLIVLPSTYVLLADVGLVPDAAPEDSTTSASSAP